MEDLASTIRAHCKFCQLRLNRDLGQHFLIDQEILDAIIEAGDIQTDEHIVEIGPGVGVLTNEILKKTKRVTAIEIDERMIPCIQTYLMREHENPQIELINKNALHVPLPEEPYKVVANIPYHITSPLLRHAFLESSRSPTSLTLLIQREVAEKICSPKDAGILTILVALFGTPKIITLVPPNAFLPPPKVDSAVLHIDCFAEPIASLEVIEQIFKLTKIAFGQKRKMLSNSIGKLSDGIELLEKANIDPMRRPQTLSIEEWMQIAKCQK